MTSVPTNIDFAAEVKQDRLNLLWKLTAVASAFIFVFCFVLFSANTFENKLWIFTPLTMLATSLLTAYWLKRGFQYAAWNFTLGAILAVVVGMSGAGVFVDLVPFLFVVVVLVGGLLLRPKATLSVSGFTILLTLIVPWVIRQEVEFTGYQLFAVALIMFATAIAIEVTGELYAVTEWALLNYTRERRSNDALFDSRQQLETSLKRAEALGERLMLTNADLENARTAAETAKKFRGQFLANMSHELRTPLNAIIGFSETMLKFPIMYDDVSLPEAYQADMNQIYASGTQLLTLINDILDLAKVDAGRLEIHRQEVDLEPIISATLATANGLIGGRNIRMVNHTNGDLPKIHADPNRARQVLLNLYSNAVKFTDEGEIVLTSAVEDNMLRLSVRDSGCGIPQESLDIIFEEFKQADQTERDPRAGAGLGLAISRQLVNMMGGHIWADSEVGKGSTFHVTFPIYTEVSNEIHQGGDEVTKQNLPAPVIMASAESAGQPDLNEPLEVK